MKRQKKHLPEGFKKKDVVKITSEAFTGYEVGLVDRPCRFDDGIIVWVPGEDDLSKYYCIDINRKGDTILKVERK